MSENEIQRNSNAFSYSIENKLKKGAISFLVLLLFLPAIPFIIMGGFTKEVQIFIIFFYPIIFIAMRIVFLQKKILMIISVKKDQSLISIQFKWTWIPIRINRISFSEIQKFTVFNQYIYPTQNHNGWPSKFNRPSLEEYDLLSLIKKDGKIIYFNQSMNFKELPQLAQKINKFLVKFGIISENDTFVSDYPSDAPNKEYIKNREERNLNFIIYMVSACLLVGIPLMLVIFAILSF